MTPPEPLLGEGGSRQLIAENSDNPMYSFLYAAKDINHQTWDPEYCGETKKERKKGKRFFPKCLRTVLIVHGGARVSDAGLNP